MTLVSVRLHKLIALGLVVGLAVAVLAGCGGHTTKAATPEQAAKMLIAAATAGNMKAADDMIAWDALAKQSNPDWDTIAKNQRTLIIDKEKQLNAGVLKKFVTPLIGGQVGQAMTQGNTAQVAVSTSAGQITLQAAKTDDEGWKIIMPAQL